MRYRRTHPITQVSKLPDFLQPKPKHIDRCCICGGIVINRKNGWVEYPDNDVSAPREKWVAYHFILDCGIMDIR